MARVVFLVLDGFPNRHVGADVTPRLWALADEAGPPPGRALGVMPADTYPNHATFVTGAEPAVHGIVANWFWTDDELRPAWEVGLRSPTIFDACGEAGRATALVAGDQHLIGVMGGDRADHHWPPGGELPDGTLEDGLGYANDTETLPRLLDTLAAGYDLVVGHLNRPDTVGHLDGPDTAWGMEGYRECDALLGGLREVLDPEWGDTVLIVTSDHSMETVSPDDPLDLTTRAEAGGLTYVPAGGVALLRGDDPERGVWLDSIDGVDGHRPIDPETRLLWTKPGRWFGFSGVAGYRGMHGNPATLEQVAVVSGGHPAASALGGVVARGTVSIRAVDWAPTMAGLLGVTLGGATGRNLLE